MFSGDKFQHLEKMISDNIANQEAIREFMKETIESCNRKIELLEESYNQKISTLECNIVELRKTIEDLKLTILQYEQRLSKCEINVGLEVMDFIKTKYNIIDQVNTLQDKPSTSSSLGNSGEEENLLSSKLKTFHCDLCCKNFQTQRDLSRHNNTKKHKQLESKTTI
jgi:hypothetical protein